MIRNRHLFLIGFQVFAGMLLACSAQTDCRGSDCQNGNKNGDQRSVFKPQVRDDTGKFNPWSGGKLSGLQVGFRETKEDKRSFSPWAGKRDSQSSTDHRADRKKTRFHPWHGKRSGAVLESLIPKRVIAVKYIDTANNKLADKRGFSPWAGK